MYSFNSGEYRRAIVTEFNFKDDFMHRCLSQPTKLFLLTILVIFMLSSCDRNRNNENEAETNENSGLVGTGMQPVEGTHTLSLSVPLMQEPQFRRAGEALRDTLAQEGIHLDLRIEYFEDANWESHFEILLSRFAAGTGPDIISGGFTPVPLYRFIENSFLADIYEMIDNSPTARREDFFTNALESMEIGGSLYIFPLQFGFDFIGINANVPNAFIERFASLESARPSDLMQLYFDLTEEHPEWSALAFANGFSEFSIIAAEYSRSVNFAAGVVNLGDAMPVTFENIRRAFANNDRFGTGFIFNPTDDEMAMLQERYLFNFIFSGSDIFEAFLDFERAFFVNYIPVADESGRLVLNGFSGTHVSINQNADPTLAWAFIEQLVSDAASEEFRNPNIPIARQYLNIALETSLYSVLSFNEPRSFLGSRHDAIAQVISPLEKYSTMSMTHNMNAFLPIPMQAFFDFLENDISAEEAVRQAEEEVSAWLNEERPIEEFQVAEEQGQPWLDANLIERTLTIHTNNMHSRVLEQAANAVNAAWWERDEPYMLRLEIDDYSWNDFEESEARATRLQTRLMAGQGPDIFLLSPHLDIHALARSGFVHDVYSLIDADPHTSRADFFEQIFSAFEMAGGLYLFPTNAGFQYVGINTKLPQSIVMRFSQYETITIAQMMEIYLDLLENYPQYDYLILATTTNRLWNARSTLESVMGGFIGFNARTANLTDSRFVTFLENLANVDNNGEIFQSWGMNGAGNTEWILQQSMVSAFMIENTQLTPANALLPVAEPIFTHYIPLVDEQERLLLDDIRWSQSIWAAFCITTTGDYSLAWEFLQHVPTGYSYPIGSAAVDAVFGTPSWGNNYITTPIRRSLFREHNLRAFDHVFLPYTLNDGSFFGSSSTQDFIGAADPIQRSQNIETAINRIAELNEQPMAMLTPMIPQALFEDDLELFLPGVITSADFAQRLQNSVSLWLIE